MTCIFPSCTCPLCLEGRQSGGLCVLYLLLHIPSLALMSSFYCALALNKELRKKNNTLAKFLQGFNAHVGATEREHALRNLLHMLLP